MFDTEIKEVTISADSQRKGHLTPFRLLLKPKNFFGVFKDLKMPETLFGISPTALDNKLKSVYYVYMYAYYVHIYVYYV